LLELLLLQTSVYLSLHFPHSLVELGAIRS
jgi:hypothetical protein